MKLKTKIFQKKIKSLALLLIFIIIPLIFNTSLINLYSNNVHENKEDLISNEPNLTPKLSAPPNAHYYSFYKIITINHNKVAGTGTYNNFPVLISIKDPDLHSDVQSNGNDIAFAYGDTWLDHEIELFDQDFNLTHAKLVAWVRIPALSGTIDTIIRMYYGNSTMSSQQNPSGVWDNYYRGVWHLNEQTGGTDAIIDSTTYSNDGTDINSPQLGQNGQIYNSIGFTDSSGQRIEVADDNSLDISDQLTVEAWINPNVDNKWMTIVSKMAGSWGSGSMSYIDLYVAVNDWGTFDIGLANPSDSYDEWQSSVYFSTGTWQHFVFTYQSSTSIGRIYVNGAYMAQHNFGIGTLGTNANPFYIGFNRGWTGEVWDGLIDEVRISSIPRSSGWIYTEYQNQNDPSSFYSIESEQLVSEVPPNANYFTFYKIITIDHNKVAGTGNHPNFPVLISLIDENLRYHAQPDGDDIAFSMDGAWLNHEIERFNQSYSATHAQLVAWVRVPYLSTTTNTTITMYYGNSTMSSRENPTGVWNTNYVGVWHLSESSGVAQDSTSYATHGTISGGVTQGSTGQIDGTYYFDGVDSKVDMGDPVDGHLDFGTGSFTVETWIYRDGTMAEGQYGGIFKGNGDVDDQNGWLFRFKETDGVRFSGGDGTASVFNIHKSYSIVDNTWIHYVGVLDRSSGNAYIYRNGHLNATDSSITSGNIDSTRTLKLSEDWSTSIHFKGLFDEIRILNVPKSSDWILTEYNNQYDPSSFYSIESEQLVSEEPPNTIYFDNYKIVTINHNKVAGTGSHPNFPLLISIIDTDLRYDVQSNGNDIAFAMDGKWLDHQIELFNQTYSATNAQLIVWVRIPFLYTSFDTNIT
ncbi:MAG: DUF2341 domain-containing protein, partial [Candidatus Thorarchaeota archaeon]